MTASKDRYSNNKTSVKLLRGRNVGRYRMLWESQEYVVEDFLIDKVNKNSENVYLVGQEITGTMDKWRLHFALTELNEKYLFGHTANKILLRDSSYNLLVLGVLNSKLEDWFFRKTSTNNHVMGYELMQLPIPIFDKEVKFEFNSIVSEVINSRKDNKEIDYINEKLNKILYEYYGFSKYEISMIEGN